MPVDRQALVRAGPVAVVVVDELVAALVEGEPHRGGSVTTTTLRRR
ncbi:hypothetical protein [Microtetraspora sp. NBRC 13810]|nr:hypothetical protein [Microtetraspora sp. NBRC 13810]